MAYAAHTIAGFTIGSSYLHGAQRVNPDYGTREIVLGHDGSPYANFAAVMSQEPTLSLDTVALATAFDAIGTIGTALSAGTPGKFYFQKIATDGWPASGAVHGCGTVNLGLVVPEQLRLRQDAHAVLTYRVHTVWDGSNDPIVYGSSQSLPSAVELSEAFTLGPVKYKGSMLEGVEEVSIDFGLAVELIRTDGTGWAKAAHVTSVRPRARVTLGQPVNLQTIGLPADGSSAQACVLWAQKLDEFGMRVAAATAEHVSLTLAEWIALPGSDDGTQGQHYTSAFSLVPTKTGETAPIAVSTASAIG